MQLLRSSRPVPFVRDLALVCVIAACSPAETPPETDDRVGGEGGGPGGGGAAGAVAGSGGAPGGGGDGVSPVVGGGGAAGAPEDGGSGAPAQPQDAAAPEAGTPTQGRSAGCGKPATGSGAWQAMTVTIRNAQRSYRMFVPRAYDPARAYPIVFVLHGAGGSGTSGDIAAFANTSKDAAILLAPSAIGGRWSFDPNGADFDLFDTLRARVGASHCIDERRVFSYGFSMGGAMSTVYACGRPGVLRAFASNRGGLPDGVPPCAPVAAWLSNSANDGVVVPSWYQPVHDAFVKLNGCAATSKPTTPSPCVQRDGCMHPLVQCAVTGGHNPEPGFAIPAAWAFFTRLE